MSASNLTPQKRKSLCANTGYSSVKKLELIYTIGRVLQDAIGRVFWCIASHLNRLEMEIERRASK